MEKVIYIHIPKTAGVTIREGLTKYYDKNEVYHVLNPKEWLASKYESELLKTKFIHGHFGWDVASNEVFNDFKKIVFIRNPLSRVRSLYNFLKGSEFSACITEADKKRVAFAKGSTFEEFALNEVVGIKGGVCNQQTKFLTSDLNPEVADSEKIETAISRLSEMFSVGVVERMQESLNILTYKLGVLPINAEVVRNSSKLISDYSSGFIDLVRERNQLDFMLYAAAEEMLNKQVVALDGLPLKKLALERLFIGEPPRNNLTLLFDESIIGENWHDCENNDSFHWRFTGPENLTTLYFPPLIKSERVLNIYIPHVICEDVFKKVKFFFNGVELKGVVVKNLQGLYVLNYRLASNIIRQDSYNELQIETIYTKSPDDGDDRLLGIAISKIELLNVIVKF